MNSDSLDAMDLPLDLERIRAIEEAAFAAWPAHAVLEVDGWRARRAEGITGRANSVCAVEHAGARPLAESLAAVEAFYAAHNLPARFQITPASLPTGLDALLDARGYRRLSSTSVQTALLPSILERTPALRALPHFAVEVAEAFDEEWFAAYGVAESLAPESVAERAAVLGRIPGPVAFARLDADGAPAAVGLGVVYGSWLGIFCMSTLSTQRRRGAATALLRTLAIWGSLYDACEAYLQVKTDNAAALAVYARAGFATAYPYHYRVR